MDNYPLTRHALAKESGLEYQFVERVIKKMDLKPVAKDKCHRMLYSLEQFTLALDQYRQRTYKENNNDKEEGETIVDLENEKLKEVIRGLKLKNDILANKLVYRDDVFNYISSYVSAELTRVKRICIQKLVLKCRNKTAQELHKLGIELYNEYLRTQQDFITNWIKKTELDADRAEEDNLPTEETDE